MTTTTSIAGADEMLRVPRGRAPQIWGLVAGGLLASGYLFVILTRGDGGWNWALVVVGLAWVIESLWNLRTPVLEISPWGIVYRRDFPLPARRIARADLEGWAEQFGNLILTPRGSKPVNIGWSHLDDTTRDRVRSHLRSMAPALDGNPGTTAER